MLNIWVFNAGHEESLYYEDEVYRTPKKGVKNIRLSLWSLMRFVARDDDLILSGNYIFGEISVFDKNGNNINIDNLPKNIFLTFWAIEPSLINYLKNLFAKRGISAISNLYSDIYRISHRRFSSELANYLIEKNNNIEKTLRPFWIDNTSLKAFDIFRETIRIIMRTNNCNRIVVKKPYTSSGRGVMFLEVADNEKCIESIFRGFNNIKEFSLEPYCNILDNWATEFFIDQNGKCSFVALSNFSQNNGKYSGNILNSQEMLYKKLSDYIKPKYDLENVIEQQRCFIESQLKNKYVGFLGIDMFTYINNMDELCLNPFVEINLRMTMGLIAHYIYKSNSDKYKLKKFVVVSNDQHYCDDEKYTEELDMWTEYKFFRVFIK